MGPANTNIRKKKNQQDLWGATIYTLVKCSKFYSLPNAPMAFHVHSYCKLWNYLHSPGAWYPSKAK